MKRIVEVEISNIKGIRFLKFCAGKTITVIKGGNGTGKSSVIDAVCSIFEGGSDPSWLRNGEQKGYVKLTGEDGTTITKTVERVKKRGWVEARIECDLEIVGPDGEVIPPAQTFVNQLVPKGAIDPGEILKIDATTEPGRKKLIALLLKLMVIEFTQQEVVSAGRIDGQSLISDPGKTVGLHELNKLQQNCIDSRARVGNDRDAALGAEAALKHQAPEGTPQDCAVALSEARANLKQAEGELESAQQGHREAHLRRVADIEKWAADRIEEIRKQQRERVARSEEERDKVVAANEMNCRPIINEYLSDVIRLEKQQEQFSKYEQLKESMAKFATTAREHQHLWDRWNEVVDRLDRLKKAKLDSLPIAGLTFEDDRVKIDGVEWPHVNTAMRVNVCVQLTAMQAGKLPFLVVDDAEHLDANVRQELHAAIEEAGFQLIEATVDEGGGPLQVEQLALS